MKDTSYYESTVAAVAAGNDDVRVDVIGRLIVPGSDGSELVIPTGVNGTWVSMQEVMRGRLTSTVTDAGPIAFTRPRTDDDGLEVVDFDDVAAGTFLVNPGRGTLGVVASVDSGTAVRALGEVLARRGDDHLVRASFLESSR